MIELDDLRNNGEKKNLKWHFGELLDELLRRISSVYRYNVNSVYILYSWLKVLSPILHHTQTFNLTQNFVSPKDLIPQLYCPVFVRFVSREPFDIVLFPQQWFLDSISSI